MAQDRVEAVERALTVMDVFNAEHESLGLSDLAQATGFYKSTLLRLLGSLERFDYVRRGSDGQWRLGMRPVQLAQRHAPSRQLAALMQPLLKQLAEDTGETAALLIKQDSDICCLLSTLPTAALRHELLPGDRWPIQGNSPCPELPGGVMEYLALPSVAENSQQWLTLSGPVGRLDSAKAKQSLLDMRATLESVAPLPELSP
jgi:hypothetical protein